MRQYGMPYQGSKQAIADWVIEHIPPANTLVDLFCGGCAITHAALLSGKWERIIANDLNISVPQLFLDSIHGKYTTETERRWISREDFFRLKDSDAYVRWCWSFANNGECYLYATEIEPFKKRLHELLFANTIKERATAWRAFVKEYDRLNADVDDLSAKARKLCEECGAECIERPDGSIDAEKTRANVHRGYSKDIREYLRNALRAANKRPSDIDKLLGTNGMAGHYFRASQWELPTAEAYAKMATVIDLPIPWAELNEKMHDLEYLQSLQRLESLQRLQSLQSLERLQSLESLQRLQRLQSLSISGKDYREVEIPPDSVVYCDIPYDCTADNYGVTFDHAAFCDWAAKQTVPVIISEYNCKDERFAALAEKDKIVLSAGAKYQKKVSERLYVPKHQLDDILARLNTQERLNLDEY